MIICIILFAMKNIGEKLDVVNPFVKRGWSYAKVPYSSDAEHLSKQEIINIQDYKDIESYDENGHKNNYLLDFKVIALLNNMSKSITKVNGFIL